MPLTADERAALKAAAADSAEARRMLGVLLGWQRPQGPEAAALDALRDAVGSPVDPAAVAQALIDAGPAIARSVADELAARLQRIG